MRRHSGTGRLGRFSHRAMVEMCLRVFFYGWRMSAGMLAVSMGMMTATVLAHGRGARVVRDDQWMERMRHPSCSLVSIIVSAPLELIAFPLKSPTEVLVLVAHAVFPDSVTLIGPRFESTARANAISPERWCDRYSLRVSIPPDSRIVASVARSARAVALSPDSRAL
jgi:hypothetical protein